MKNFWSLFWVQFFGAFNDNVFKNAIIILVAYKSYSMAGLSPEQVVSLCGGIFILPYFLFSTLAGTLSDKYPRLIIIRLVKWLEILIMVLGSIGFLTENFPLLLIGLFLMGAQSTFFGPAKYSALPEIVERKELTRANAYFSVGTFISILLGTILGGVTISLPKNGAELTCVVVIFLAIIGTFFSHLFKKDLQAHPDQKIKWNPFAPLKDIFSNKNLRKDIYYSIYGVSWYWFLGAAFLSVIPIYAKDYLGADSHVATFFLAIFSVGVACGALLCNKLSGKKIELGLVPLGSLLISVFLLILYFVGRPADLVKSEDLYSLSEFLQKGGVLISLILFAFASVSALFFLPLQTYIQERSDDSERSQMIAANNFFNSLFMVASALFLIPLYSLGLNSLEVVVVLALLNLLVSVFVYFLVTQDFYSVICRLFATTVYRFKVKGGEQIPAKGALVYVCNHVSFIDWLIIMGMSPRPVRFIMHYEYMNIPLIGFITKHFFKRAKLIPIAGRFEDKAVLQLALDSISEGIRSGDVICLFPEGKITKTGELERFRTGVLDIVKRDPCPVVPMFLEGLWGSFFSRKYGRALKRPFFKLRAAVNLHIGEPIDASDVSIELLEKRIRDLAKKV
jgi:1-acyl-sn-glycerol-3-phosphate acyltransferase